MMNYIPASRPGIAITEIKRIRKGALMTTRNVEPESDMFIAGRKRTDGNGTQSNRAGTS
jgi:hypothetical protein